jgi:serine/threonine protein kinase
VEQREVALKIGRKSAQAGDADLTPLEREALVGQILPNHDNVVQLYDLHYLRGIDCGRLVALSMEMVGGGTLRDWLRSTNPDEAVEVARGLEYFESLCLGVGALHGVGLLHLDLKPEHVLLDGRIVRVCDYGSAMAMRNQAGAGDLSIPPPPARSGTVHYMAPECFSAGSMHELDERADVYALGVILFEILGPDHKPPFTGSYRQISHLHQNAALPDIPWLTPGQSDVLACCTAKTPSERFPAVEDLLDALHSAFADGVDAIHAPGSPPVGQETEDEVSTLAAPEVSRHDSMAAGTTLFEEVKRELDSGDLEELLELAAEGTDLNPDDAEGRALCARLAHRVRAFNRSIEDCRRAIDEGDHEQALRFARRASAVNPGAAEARELVARIENRIESVDQRKAEMMEAARAGEDERALLIAQQLDEEGVPG